jgi:hypothetical protein
MAIKFKVVTAPPFSLQEIVTPQVSFKMEVALHGIKERRAMLEKYKTLLFNKEVEIARVTQRIASKALADAMENTEEFTAQWQIAAQADSALQIALDVQDADLIAFYFAMVQRIYDVPVKDETGADALADTSEYTVLGLQDSQEALAVLLEELGDNPVVRDAIVKAVENVFTNVNKEDAAVKG